MTTAARLRRGWPVAVLFLTAAVLGSRHLGTASQAGDEVVYRRAAGDLLAGVWTTNLQHPPLAKELIALARVALTPWGVPELVADRSVGLVCFLLTGLVVGALGRRLAGPAAGLVAAGLWWFLPLAPGVLRQHVDRYALLEGPTLLFTAVAVLAGCRVVDRPGAARWLVAGAAVGAATASKLTGVLSATAVLAAAVVLLATRRTPAGTVVGGAVAAGLCAVVVFGLTYLPMGPATAGPALETVVRFQLEHSADGHPQEVAGRISGFPPWWSPWWFQARYLTWAGLLALWAPALAGAAVLLRRKDSRGQAVVVVAVLAAVAAALALGPLKLPHYHALLVPVLDVLAGAGVVAGLTGRLRWRVPAALALVPLVVVAAVGVARTWSMQQGDYAAAATVLHERGLDGGTVALWGDRPAAEAALPRADLTTVPDPDCSVPVLLVDDTVVRRLPAVDLPGWLARCGDREVLTFEQVTLYVRLTPDGAGPSAGRAG